MCDMVLNFGLKSRLVKETNDKTNNLDWVDLSKRGQESRVAPEELLRAKPKGNSIIIASAIFKETQANSYYST